MSIASAERVSSEMFCSSVFYEMMFFEDSWGENRGVLEKAEKYFFLKTGFISGIRLSQRERERDECATERERERKRET